MMCLNNIICDIHLSDIALKCCNIFRLYLDSWIYIFILFEGYLSFCFGCLDWFCNAFYLQNCH